ncbi:5'-3' exonuclease [Candidatus Phytoplasma melaleucae]|uniref:5'-3' exonuclease n=1 Tax=Candidatus Phytoplasma melaleucae TaxID=2982630 RepID=A0ABT9DDB1_9MOLU|nr:5'-3' exonuclease H3TH domain-containing protein ['Melaleuca sp.' phytoplasma]MDO8167873.1 5'-3' exonuclease ['Melaleuca sp.' phytoplasma]MDV3205220.1 5'-3' exonuclease H3TH domain-containing protein [Weeping tea tree witches'-broom phytoplasma]
MENLILVDGNALIFRAYYATFYKQNKLNPNANDSNENLRALMIFINMFEKILAKTQKHILVAFDSKHRTKKHEIYLDYKKGRAPTPPSLIKQINLAKEYLTLSGIRYHSQDGYEADDIIATIAKQASINNIMTFIYSSDKDFLQLIDNNITVCLIKQGLTKVIYYDPQFLWHKYNLKPSQIVDFKSMVGDSSDNIKGIPTIGPKTATKLLNQFESLDNLFRNLEKMPDKLKIKFIDFKEKLFFNRFLVLLNEFVPLSFDYGRKRCLNVE